MAIAVVNFPTPVDAGSASSVTTSPTFTSTSGNILIGCGIAAGDTSLAVGVPPFGDGGTNTFTTGHDSGRVLSTLLVSMEWVPNITGKANEAVTWTINEAQFPSAGCIEASGIATSSPNDVAPSYTTKAAGAGTTLNSSLITPPAGDHLIVVVGLFDGASANQSVTNNGTGTASWTAKADNTATNEPMLVAYAIVTADGSHTYGVTYNSGSASTSALVCGIAAFKATGGGGGGTPIAPLMRTLRGVGI